MSALPRSPFAVVLLPAHADASAVVEAVVAAAAQHGYSAESTRRFLAHRLSLVPPTQTVSFRASVARCAAEYLGYSFATA